MRPPKMESSAGDQLDRIRRLGILERDPLLDQKLQAVVASLSDPATRDAIEPDERHGSRIGRKGAALLFATLAVLLGVGVAAPAVAIGSWLAHTGAFSTPSTESDGSEIIDLTAPDVPQVVIDELPDYLKLGDGYTDDDAIRGVAASFDRIRGTDTSVKTELGLFATQYEFYSVCTFYDAWLNADDSGDDKGRASADGALGDMQNFPSIVAHDGGGVVEHLTEVAASAQAGDRDAVLGGYEVGACDQMLGKK